MRVLCVLLIYIAVSLVIYKSGNEIVLPIVKCTVFLQLQLEYGLHGVNLKAVRVYTYLLFGYTQNISDKVREHLEV